MEKENIYSKVAKIIQKPYFKDLSEMGFHDKKSHDQILSIVFNKPVYITDNWNEVLDKKDNNPLYYETPDGYWELYRWDNDHLTYKEYPNGDYLRKAYDNYGNLIEHEELDMGNLSIYRYDQNENQIYYENNGFWIVSEFNSNNELIYREKSDGDIYDIRSKKNITESVEDKNSYYKKIIPLLKKPYMVDFINFNIPRNDWKDIFKMIYGWISTIHMSQSFEILNGGVSLPQYVQVMLEIPHTGKELLVYYEDEDGDWVEKEYDTKTGKLIGFEDGDGKSYVTESVDRKQKFYNYIVKTMLDDTKYEIIEKNYGGTMTEKIVSIKFPMYPWEEYTYKPWDIHRWKFDEWMMGAMDIDYVVDNFGVDEKLAEIIFKKYIKELSLEISEKMPF
jgi:hypothetical protein